MRTKRWGLCLAVLLALHAGASAAAPTGYASAFEGLYQVDLATGDASRIGVYGSLGANAIRDIEGLTFLPDGNIVGVSDANKALFRFAVGNSRAAFLANLAQELRGFTALDIGLAAGCDGTLYVSSDAQRKLWRLSQDGSAIFIADLPAAISGLAFRNDFLYGIAIASPNVQAQGLYRIDPATGQSTLLGNFTTPRAIQDAGLDFSADGRLWATFDYNPPATGNIVDYSDIAQLDPETGALLSRTTVRGIPEGSDFEGLAIAAPVCQGPDGTPPPASSLPVPAGSTTTWLALVLGFLALAGTTLRRFAR